MPRVVKIRQKANTWRRRRADAQRKRRDKRASFNTTGVEFTRKYLSASMQHVRCAWFVVDEPLLMLALSFRKKVTKSVEIASEP
jgi:hypothetical protein